MIIYVIFIVSSKSLHVPNFTCRISHASQSKSVYLKIYVYMFIIATMPLIRGWYVVIYIIYNVLT